MLIKFANFFQLEYFKNYLSYQYNPGCFGKLILAALNSLKKYIYKKDHVFFSNISIECLVFMIVDLLAALSQKVFIILRQTKMRQKPDISIYKLPENDLKVIISIFDIWA